MLSVLSEPIIGVIHMYLLLCKCKYLKGWRLMKPHIFQTSAEN